MLQPQEAANPTRIARDPAIVRSAIHVIIAAQYAYTFAFIHLPADVRLAFAGILLLAQATLAGVALARRPSWASNLIVLAGMTTVVCWGVSYGSGFGDSRFAFDPRYISKDLQTFITPIWLLAYWDQLRVRFIVIMAIGAILVGGILAFTGPPLQIPGEYWDTRLSIVTGELDLPPHDSAYFILLNAFLVDQLWRTRMISRSVAWPLIAFAAVLLIGFQARTAWMMFGAYYLTVLYYRWRHLELVRSLPAVFLGLAAVGIVAYLSFTSEDIARLGSGRMASYMLRLEILANRDLAPLLFGSGLGTDRFATKVWYWGEYGAHNDYLHASIEVGLIGLVALVAYLLALYIQLPVLGKPLFYALIVGSTFSNGLLGRPTLSIYLFLAAALSIALTKRLGLPESRGIR